MSVMLERDVKAAVLDYLACVPNSRWWRRNVLAIPMVHNGKKRFLKAGEPGQSDIYGIWNGVHCEIELKRPGKTPTEDQKRYLLDIRSLGGIAIWCDSLDSCIEKLDDERRRMGWHK